MGKKLATLFPRCLVPKVLQIFNYCYFHTPQAGSHDTDAALWGRSHLNRQNIVTRHFPTASQSFQTVVWGIRLKSPQGSENPPVREGNTFHCHYTFVNISFHKKSIQTKLFLPKPQRNNGPVTPPQVLSPHRSIKQTLSLCLPCLL